MSRVFEKPESMPIARNRPAHHFQQILVAVVVDIRKRHAVPFVQLAGAGGSRDIHERFSRFVMQQHIGQQSGIGRFSGAEINIGIAVVIHIAEIRTHWHEDFVQPGFLRHIAKGAVTQIVIQLHGGGVVGQSQIRARAFLDRHRVAGRQKIRPAVVVVVEKPGGKAMA